MTFNLRRDVAHDGAHAWPHRRAGVAALVLRESPDVLGTQEGLAHQLVDLDASLPDHVRVGGCRRGDGTDEACAVYYRRDRFELDSWGDLWLSDTPASPGSRSWGNRLPRLVTWASLRDRASGQCVSVANTHLDHESPHARLRAAAFLTKRFPRAVLMGDFNEAPGGPVHDALTRAGWVDAGSGCEEGTFHAYSGIATERIDWVLVPAELRASSHRVHVSEGSVWPSDHHPVVTELVRA